MKNKEGKSVKKNDSDIVRTAAINTKTILKVHFFNIKRK